MKKTALLMAFVLLLFTACSSAPQTSEEGSKLDYEELTDHVYVGYDRTKYEDVSAPPVYYAQAITPDESVLASFFSSPPKIYVDDDGDRIFENDSEYGRCGSHGIISYRTHDGINIYMASHFCIDDKMSSVKELDFMPFEELYKRFDEDVHKFIDKYEIYEMTAFTAETFEEITSFTEPSDIEKGWCEPRDVYYIRARQFVNEIPIFKGAYTLNPNDVPAMYHAGAQIEACYTKNGLEYFDIFGSYQIGEEKTADGEFVDLKSAEQIIRDYYNIPYPCRDTILYDCTLVYVGDFEGEKTILTPAWEFYSNYGQGSWYDIGSPMIRINAYTGDLMWGS